MDSQEGRLKQIIEVEKNIAERINQEVGHIRDLHELKLLFQRTIDSVSRRSFWTGIGVSSVLWLGVLIYAKIL